MHFSAFYFIAKVKKKLTVVKKKSSASIIVDNDRSGD